MNEKTLRALIEAGAVRQARIIADGSTIYVEASTANQTVTAHTVSGKLKTWSTIDSAAKWVRTIGLGSVSLDIARWTPRQRSIKV